MSVNDAMEESLSFIKPNADRHNIVLRKELHPELNYIEADRQKFKQILFNLLSNAVKFSKQAQNNS